MIAPGSFGWQRLSVVAIEERRLRRGCERVELAEAAAQEPSQPEFLIYVQAHTRQA